MGFFLVIPKEDYLHIEKNYFKFYVGQQLVCKKTQQIKMNLIISTIGIRLRHCIHKQFYHFLYLNISYTKHTNFHFVQTKVTVVLKNRPLYA